MTLTKGRIERVGKIHFHDASLAVLEEGIAEARKHGGYDGAQQWERKFKLDVFTRIVQQLNRLGWTCVIPQEMIKQYSFSFASDRRYCTKGDLQADLSVSGRCIELKMFQNVNAPDRPDHGGRYQHGQEQCMPYVMRLEMERTRRRIRDYLRNVFTGYEFSSKRSDGRNNKCGFMHLTALEWIDACYATSWHFKGDLTKHQISDYNRKSADSFMLDHGQRVYFADRKGRINTGTAYYNINNMWWVSTGKYDVTNVSSGELYTNCPENLRIKRNARQRRKRLEAELSKAIAAMNFERAAILRDILFPGDPELFVVWHDEHRLYHCSGFCGYTPDQSKAGKFTADEVRNWNSPPNRVIALSRAKEAA